MITHYIKLAIRSFATHKTYYIINLLGLTIGLVAFLLLALYVHYELNYDVHIKDSERIYRVYGEYSINNEKSFGAKTPVPLATFLQKSYSGVENTCRIMPVDKLAVEALENAFYESGIVFADTSVLDFFGFEVLKGTEKHIFKNPHSIVLTQGISEKYFGSNDPIGKTITIADTIDFTVAAIIQDIPANTHFDFEFVIPYQNYRSVFNNDNLDNKMNTTVYSYIKLMPATDPSEFLERISSNLSKDYLGVGISEAFGIRYHCQPLHKIHLYSKLGNEFKPNSDVRYIYLLSALAILIVIIVCINHINLSAALYTKRLPGINLFKVLGSSKRQLVKLLFTEAYIQVFASLFIVTILATIILPWFNTLVQREITFSVLEVKTFTALLTLFLWVGFFTGIYPAIFISRNASTARSNRTSANSKESLSGLRKGLVVFQFSISVVLIVCTLTIWQQIEYIKNKNLGFRKDELMIIPLTDEMRDKIEYIKQQLSQHSSILSVTSASSLPGELNFVTSIVYEGMPKEHGLQTMSYLNVDEAFINSLGIDLVKGRNFNRTNNQVPEYIINESAAKFFGTSDPLGMWIETPQGGRGVVVGVIKDFNFKSLHTNIEPLFLSNSGKSIEYLFVKIATSGIPSSISKVQDVLSDFSGLHQDNLQFFFYDDYYENLYTSETNFGTVVLASSLIAIFIASLGLFAIVTYSVNRQRKEIAIRKVFGASFGNLFLSMSKSYVQILFIALLVAYPVAYYIAKDWLSNFAYRIRPEWLFLFSGMLVFAIAFAIIGNQIVKATNINPIKWIRNE